MHSPKGSSPYRISIACAVALLMLAGCGPSTSLSDAETDAPDAEVADTADGEPDTEPETADPGTDDAQDVPEDSEPDGLDAPDGDGEGGVGEIVGDIDDVHFDPTYAGLGNLWVYTTSGWLRYGQNVMLADLPSLCEVMGSGTDPDELWALAFWFSDVAPGTYAVKESTDESDIGTSVVEVYLTGRHAGENIPKRHAVSGEVVLESIAPTTSEPLTAASVATGTFTLTFLFDANVTVECMTMCGPDGCTSTCDCRRPDGSGFTCDTDDAARSCCNDGITETQTVTGSFRASYCLYQCACYGSDPGCPCFG